MATRRRRQRPKYPATAERRYAEAAADVVRSSWSGLGERLVRGYARAIASRIDADDHGDDSPPDTHRTIPGTLSELIGGIGAEYGRRLAKRGELLPMVHGRSAADYGAQTFEQELGAIIGIQPLDEEPWLTPALEAWNASNVQLIKNLAPRHMADVEDLVAETWRSGKRAEDLARDLQARLGISERRAMLIARDQIGKLNGQLQMVRQASYGVDGYIWRTSLDERVRQVHADREGERFGWGDPPPDGHPGMPIQCRCVAEPDIDAQLAELERLGEETLVQGLPEEALIDDSIRALAEYAPDPADVDAWVRTAVEGVRALQDDEAAERERNEAAARALQRFPRAPRTGRTGRPAARSGR
jgi:SPP1 gp7 family putative phage head morphogenesis protein